MLELGGRQFLASRQGQRGVGVPVPVPVPVPVQGFCCLEIVKRLLYTVLYMYTKY